MATKSDMFGAEGYRRGALERLQEAGTLLDAGRFAGSIYLSGRGVEGMLRAVLWRKDWEIQQGRKVLETGHDLRELLSQVRNLGLLRPRHDETLQAQVQEVARLWFNNLRFASSQFLDRHWRRIGQLHSRRTLKQAATEFFDVCSAIIKRCEELYAGAQ